MPTLPISWILAVAEYPTRDLPTAWPFVVRSMYLRTNLYFPMLVLKGIYHYWIYMYIYFFPGVLAKWKVRSEPPRGLG